MVARGSSPLLSSFASSVGVGPPPYTCVIADCTVPVPIEPLDEHSQINRDLLAERGDYARSQAGAPSPGGEPPYAYYDPHQDPLSNLPRGPFDSALAQDNRRECPDLPPPGSTDKWGGPPIQMLHHLNTRPSLGSSAPLALLALLPWRPVGARRAPCSRRGSRRLSLFF
uniref:Uncharacterized protein n=1 Tax=Alexandrium monilatum TaxID=311494 RepID=A0A7S4QVM2_9DINO